MKEFLRKYISNISDKIILNTNKTIDNIKPGMVIDIPTDKLPITILVIDRFVNDIYECVLLSYLIECKTYNDILIEIDHPIRDKFIVEADIPLYINEYILQHSNHICNINNVIMEDIIEFIYSEDSDNNLYEPTYEDIVFKKMEISRIKPIFKIGMDNLIYLMEEAE